MKNITITREEIETLAGQRDAQVAAVENAHMKEHGEKKPLHVSTLKTWARVALGGVDCALPIRRLLKWAATFDKGAEFRVGMSDDKRNVCFVCGSSSLKLAMRDDVWSEELPARSAPGKVELGEAIVISEGENGVLTVQRAFAESDKASLRQAKADARAVADAKKAREASRLALGELRKGVQLHHANIAAISGGKDAAIALAKATRDAWREVRTAKANPATIPAWGTWQAQRGDYAVIEAQKHALDLEYANFTRGNLAAIGRKMDKLAQKLKSAKVDMMRQIHADGIAYCESVGVASPRALYSARAYSRARLFVRDWREKKQRLSLAYISALEKQRGGSILRVKSLPSAGSELPVAPAFTHIDGAVTATLNFQSHETAKAFARKWAMHTLRGYALSRRGDDGAAVLTLYRVTKEDKQWIDAEVAAQATQAPIPATIAPVAATDEKIESFTYLDTAEEIARKLGVLERNRGKLLASIAEALASPERMARMQKWQNRTAKEWLRNEIVKLCHAARSWARSNGMGSGLCHRDKATEDQLAARAFLIAELNIWREARRIHLASIAPPPLAVNVPPLAVCEREEAIASPSVAPDEVFSSFPSLRALFAHEKDHIIPFPDQQAADRREVFSREAVQA